MGKYVGQEHTMYLKICKKYNVQPEPEIKADAGVLSCFFRSLAWFVCLFVRWLMICVIVLFCRLSCTTKWL